MQQIEPKKPESELSPKLEKLIEDIDSGKEKMHKSGSVDAFIKEINKIVTEE